MTLPDALQSLTLGEMFNMRLTGVALPVLCKVWPLETILIYTTTTPWKE
jgi:hypothetical protein